MTVTERLGRKIAQGAMNEVAEAFEPPWWLGLLGMASLFFWGTHQKKSRKNDIQPVYREDDFEIFYF